LLVDGILKPKGETESALRQRLVAERPQSKRPVHAFIFAPERESIFDATGRMRRPEEIGKKREPLFNRDVLLSLADKYKPKPFTEEEIKEKLRERVIKNAAAGNNAAQSKPSIPVPQQKPITPAVKKALEETRRNLKSFDENQYRLSSKFLRHYLGGSGQALKISSKEIEDSDLYKRAIKTNQRRFEDSITKGVVDAKFKDGKFVQKIEGIPSDFKDRILKLKNGQTIILDNSKALSADDVWDKYIKRSESYVYDPDYALALGAVKLKSLGNLRATRKGNKVEITGEVYHTLKDRYDFNDDTLVDKALFKNHRLLAKEGYAKPFEVYGSTSRSVSGSLEIKNGRITNPEFKWKDIK